ncbi:cytochrome P450 4V2 [Caerostris darwini]|uniref:Cytochrome P450 4V2 n=1 Tax=Caerostris darwini TaxID=1538125 RepID=A0AAV4RQN9_9ARAC|nr:cytochrome P450 4V2 [Caerostris darwini]
MFFEVVVCAFIGFIAVLALLILWRKKYTRFVPDNRHSVFQVLVDAMDSILFVTSGKKNALHLSTVPSGKSEGSCSLLVSRAACSKDTSLSSTSMLRNWSSFYKKKRAKNLQCIFGVKIGALQSEAEEFVSSLQRLLDLTMSRIWKFWLWPDFIFHCSSTHKEFLQHIRAVQGLSRRIIKERKLKNMNGKIGDDSRRSKYLLDVLLKLHIEDQVLDGDGVRQEVDTFILAGHETVAVAVKWALYLIGMYPEVQERIHQELDSVLGADSKVPIPIDDLKELKFLDCVLKVRSNSKQGHQWMDFFPIILSLFLKSSFLFDKNSYF